MLTSIYVLLDLLPLRNCLAACTLLSFLSFGSCNNTHMGSTLEMLAKPATQTMLSAWVALMPRLHARQLSDLQASVLVMLRKAKSLLFAGS